MNHDEWLEHRRQGIGSSDAPIVMCVSPYMTPYQLWEEKLGKKKSERNTFILDKGHRLEPIARSLIEFELGKDFPPKLVQSESIPWLKASLDGYSEDGDIIEIKYMGKDEHEAGLCPERYFPQVQHQLLITGATKAYLCSFNPDHETKLKIIPVIRDDEYLKKYLEIASAFWQSVIDASPPELTKKDAKKIRDGHLIQLANEYATIDLKIKELKKQQDDIEKKMIADDKINSHAKVECGRLSFTKIERIGNVNYKNIPELNGVDLDKYRGKPSIHTKITVIS